VQWSLKTTCQSLNQQHESPVFWTSPQLQVSKGEQTVLLSHGGALAEGQGERMSQGWNDLEKTLTRGGAGGGGVVGKGGGGGRGEK
jgi:hypothetical protein